MKQTFSILIVIFAVILLFGQGAQAQDDWTLKSPATKPSARYFHAMVSLGGDQVLLFGGNVASGYNDYDDETWVYDLSDSTWTLKSPDTRPSARYLHKMASLGGDQVLLFGGFDGAFDDETWVYDLSDNTWTLKSPATKPSVRHSHTMASLGGDQVLLFGGWDGAENDETWVYDLSDNTWTLKSPATKPSVRAAHAMASLGGDQVLLFGGVNASVYDDETWVYDLSDNTWTLKSPATKPPARFGHAMASLGGDQVLLFGGWDGAYDDETWVYDLSDSTWTLKSPATKPSVRAYHAMASLGSDQVLLFGGYDGANYDDTWVYTSEASPPSPVSVDIGPATLFMGVTNSDNNGRRIDLMVEIYRNSELIGQASVLNQQVSGNALNNSKKFVIPLSVSGEFGPTDLLDARVSIRRVGGSGNFGVRFWYGKDSTNSTSKGWSRIHKVGGSASNYYYFRDGNILATAPGTTGIASTLTATTTYQSFGTWQILGSMLKPGGEEITERAEMHPTTYELSQNFPNPFNPTTTIKYDLQTDSYVSLKVFDILGREVVSLVDEVETAGRHQVTLNASDLSSGVYFYRLKAGSFTNTKRLLLLK